MSASSRKSGRPLATLGGILALWLLVRVALWQSPFPFTLPPLTELAPKAPSFTISGSAVPERASPPTFAPQSTALSPAAAPLIPTHPAPFFEPAALASRGEPFDQSSAHQLMWLAAYAPERGDHLTSAPPTAPDRALRTIPQPAGFAAAPTSSGAASRWSFSGWAFLREGSRAAPGGGVAIPFYGASQAGGVLGYQLAPRSPLKPTAYLRLTSALEQRDDREAATGLSIRPVRSVPVLVLAEARWRDTAGGGTVRPAVMAISALEPQPLGPHLTAESYAQAGYVGGRGATAFADGQIRVTGGIARFDLGDIRVGAGAWGGAQRGAARLDVGPTAQIDLSLGRTLARVAVDYRVRVAGEAAPGSGLAVTLSTGF